MSLEALNKLFNSAEKNAKTFTKARKERVRKTEKRILHNVLLVKDRLAFREQDILMGKLERGFIHVTWRKLVCHDCRNEVEKVEKIQVVYLDRKGNHHLKGLDGEIRTHSMLDFNSDLPIKFHELPKSFSPSCMSCLRTRGEKHEN